MVLGRISVQILSNSRWTEPKLTVLFPPRSEEALLTIYDMCKAVDRGMSIHDVRVQEKHGGKSGSYVAPSP